MATLPTSNLSVKLICQTLGVNSPEAIFYNQPGRVLKTKNEIQTIVNKNKLDPTYCPGNNPNARITNLLADRNLKYFKGYIY